MKTQDQKMKVRISGIDNIPESSVSKSQLDLSKINCDDKIFQSCIDIYNDSTCNNVLIVESIELDTIARCREIINDYTENEEGTVIYPADPESIEPYIESVSNEVKKYCINTVIDGVNKQSVANLRKENINNLNRICFGQHKNYKIIVDLQTALFRYIDFLYNLVNSKSN